MAVEVLRSDGVISYPTDTIYGLGASIRSKTALERIYTIKKITGTKLLSFLCKDIKQIAEYAHISNANYKILRRCLPGGGEGGAEATGSKKSSGERGGTAGPSGPPARVSRAPPACETSHSDESVLSRDGSYF